MTRVFVEFDKTLEIPDGWSLLKSTPNRNTPITLYWALKQRNLDVLERIFWEVSDPQSLKYGQHKTLEELADIVAPEESEIDYMMKWLQSFSPLSISISLSRDFIVTKFRLSTAEEILRVRFSYFNYQGSDIRFLRTLDPYTLPASIAEKIDFVGGVHRLPTPHLPLETENSEPNAAVTPATIRSRYNVTDIGSNPANSAATSQFLLQWYSSSDLAKFFSQNKLPDYKVAKVVGENHEDIPGIEASLDIQYLMGVSQNITTWFYFTAGYDNDGQEPFLEWIIALNNDSNTPLVNSVSYGDYENSISFDYLDRCNVEFQKFGASGHSLLFASGDWGVGCNGTKHSPVWPTSSPYVTSVGGTQMVMNNEVGVTFSGGGFSNYFSQPSYQTQAVKTFLSTSTDLPPASSFNSSGRAYPDISAFATNYQVVVHGITTSVGGTSASTPTVSAIVALLNDYRLSKGESSLGFLNPLIYQTFDTQPTAFYDVTSGSNDYKTCKGFTARSGWDPITGVGTPNYPILKKLI